MPTSTSSHDAKTFLKGDALAAGFAAARVVDPREFSALHAERDGTVAEVLVSAGDQIDAKDLLVVFE